MITITENAAAYAEEAGAFALNVRDTGQRPEVHYGKRQWHFTIHVEGALLMQGDDIYGHGDAREALGTLLSFLGADAERYQLHMGPVPAGQDEYLFGEPVAEWAYMVSDELAMAYAEITDVEEGH